MQYLYYQFWWIKDEKRNTQTHKNQWADSTARTTKAANKMADKEL